MAWHYIRKSAKNLKTYESSKVGLSEEHQPPINQSMGLALGTTMSHMDHWDTQTSFERTTTFSYVAKQDNPEIFKQMREEFAQLAEKATEEEAKGRGDKGKTLLGLVWVHQKLQPSLLVLIPLWDLYFITKTCQLCLTKCYKQICQVASMTWTEHDTNDA